MELAIETRGSVSAEKSPKDKDKEKDMPQTTAQRRNAARELARRLWVNVGGTATMDLDDLLAAVGSIDDTMDALPGALTANQTVKQNFVARLPEPFKANSTAQQKAVALMVWAMQETGLLG